MPTALPVSLACICLKLAGKLEEGAGGKQASMRLGAKNPSPNGKWQTRYSAHPGWAAGFISSCGLFAHTPAPGVREAKMLRPTHGGWDSTLDGHRSSKVGREWENCSGEGTGARF